MRTETSTKICEVRDFVSEQNPDLLLVQETKLQPGLDPLIANYRFHKDDRNNFLRSRIDRAYARNTPQNNRKFPDKDFLKILNSGQNIIIAGDLNAAHRTWSNARSNAFGYALHKIVNNKSNKYDACRRQIYRPISKRNRRTTAQQVANQFLAASGKQISRKTVARRLRGGGLYARRPVVCVPLTRQHRTARLQWCREHHNWTEQDWTCELFSDDSRFSLSSDCRRQLIWRESGTAYCPENIQEKDRYSTRSIMVWTGIMINGRTRLHVVVNGTMRGQRYIDEVLLPHVRLFRGAVGDKICFYGRQRNMSSNTRCSGLSRQRGYSTSRMASAFSRSKPH
ncbi:transposable element Tcb2 transposase [Trichonephila clavipes]|nr:transposable element Tcb2 transposase [Trichonephila clavipes]